MSKLYKKLNEHKKYLENLGYDVIYIGLYGSQNYNLDDEESDIDSKAVVNVNLDMLLKRKDLSIVYDLDDGQIDVKDALSFYEVVKKGNPAFLEAIHSKYFIGDKTFRNLLIQIDVHPMAMIGMMRQKREALEKRLPNSYPYMDKYGYDPKQYHHIVRLYDALKHMQDSGSTDFLIQYSDDRRIAMINDKRNPSLSVEEAIDNASAMIQEAEAMYQAYQYESKDISNDFYHYLKTRVLKHLIDTSDLDYSVEQHRTFGQNIPKRDKLLFPQLKELEAFDISYTIYSYLEILDWGKPYTKKGDQDEDL